ncbi:hypothetical protein BDV27DRAFT_146297 [Aspergillus caelatus]|uniref:Uncharacterized protein n=1 Tax=Aspergillus caelatus TaxID=61420 RepID=A0A5N7A248_9EURO|nr:uncharacterized protein BDV27DRAFT_146297 [Aspergillus caelatus]KAE8363256.1 hypothetical protein BDV27DRAFT_146297 [Aspergillus caelatus]
MDLFLYNPTYQIWICTAPRCQYAISPTTLVSHLRTRYRSHPSAATPALQQAALTAILQRPWINPEIEIICLPSPSSPPIVGLSVFRGYGCLYCEYIYENYIDRDRGRQKRGRETAAQTQARLQTRLAERIVSCQRFFINRAASRFFERLKKTASLKTPAAIIRARVEQALQESQATAEQTDGQIPIIDPHPTAVSPWLELTRWPEYLCSQDLTAAYRVIKDGRINEFDQIQINTFFRRPSIWNRPIQIHLRPRTYREYCRVWQRLVCFAYRSSRTDQPIPLRHQLTTAQFCRARSDGDL